MQDIARPHMRLAHLFPEPVRAAISPIEPLLHKLLQLDRLGDLWQSADEWFNPAAFVAPPAFTFGVLGRNTVIGPGLVNLDASVARKFRITERIGLQLRAEFFNLPNHPNFNLVGRIINQPNFGGVLSQFDPRQIQFAAKFSF
jgi:hypothetical protein